MEKRIKQDRIYQVILIIALILSVFLHLRGIGSFGMTENEALRANQAYQLSRNDGVVNGSQSLYLVPTSMLFRMFGSSEAMARLIPALAGLALSLLPLIFLKRRGIRWTTIALILFGLDAAIMGWGRYADALIPVIALTLFSVIAFRAGKHAFAWILISLAALGGERFLPFLIATAGAFMVYRVMHRDQACPLWKRGVFTLKNGAIALVTLLLGSTAFLSRPAGLTAIGNGLAEFFAPDVMGGTMATVGLKAGVIAFFVYCLPLFAITIVYYFKKLTDWRSRLEEFLPIFAFTLIALFLRQGILILPWISVYFCFRSADVLDDFLQSESIRQIDGAFLASAVIPVTAYAFLYFRVCEIMRMQVVSTPLTVNWNQKIVTLPISQLQGYILVILICILIVLLLFQVLFSYFGKGSIVAGIKTGFLVIGFFWMFNNMWMIGGYSNQADNPTQNGHMRNVELLFGNQTYQAETPVFEILEEISLKKTGYKHLIDAEIQMPDDQIMIWKMRKNPNARFTSIAGLIQPLPSCVIGDAEMRKEEMVAAKYLGNLIPWKVETQWNAWLTADWLNWLIYRDAKTTLINMSLWQNSDFLSGQGDKK